MNEFVKTDPYKEEINVFSRINKQWMLITAGDKNHFNTMTASWGGMGVIWERPVAFVFIRPQRYTLEFTEKEPVMTLSFFDEKFRSALNICGSRSGRNTDKVKESGLTPMEVPSGSMAFNEADYILECRKLYADSLKEACFIDTDIRKKIYPKNDFHRMYVVEIETFWKRINPIRSVFL